MEGVRVIDWENSANNEFLLVSQFSVTGTLYPCRPDLVGFVNGLPRVVIGLKKPGVPARAALDENLTHYKSGTTPNPQPLSHRMGEGSVGFFPFEAERETRFVSGAPATIPDHIGRSELLRLKGRRSA